MNAIGASSITQQTGVRPPPPPPPPIAGGSDTGAIGSLIASLGEQDTDLFAMLEELFGRGSVVDERV